MAHFTLQKHIISRLDGVPRTRALSPPAQLLDLWKSVEHACCIGASKVNFGSNIRFATSVDLYELRGARKMTMRRRVRKADPLALVSEIRKVIDDLRRRCPDLIPASDRGVLKLMNAVRHVEQRPAGDSKSGRPGHFPREKLLEVSRHLKAALAKNYRDRISLGTFIGFYLPILNYPSDFSTRWKMARSRGLRPRRSRASFPSVSTSSRRRLSPSGKRSYRIISKCRARIPSCAGAWRSCWATKRS